MPHDGNFCRRDAAFSVRRPNRKHQVPLPEQSLVGLKQRIARVVNTGRFRSCAVQFDYLEIVSRAKILFAGKPDVVTAYVKSGKLSRYFIDPLDKRWSAEMNPIAKDA